MVAAIMHLPVNHAERWKSTVYAVISDLPKATREQMRGIIDQPAHQSQIAKMMLCGIGRCESLKSPAGDMIKKLSESRDWEFEVFGLGLVDLASPAISTPVIRDLIKSPRTSDIARTILRLNPNCPQEAGNRVPHDGALPVLPANALLALAKHGDLTKAQNQRRLQGFVESTAGADKAVLEKTCITLANREDIPPKLAEAIHPHVYGETLRTLEGTEGHRQFIQEELKGKSAFEDFISFKSLDLPRDFPAEKIEEFYNKLKTVAWGDTLIFEARVKLALLPNASKSLMDRVTDSETRCHMLKQHLKNETGPVAEYGIRSIFNHHPNGFNPSELVSKLKNPSQEIIDWAFKVSPKPPADIVFALVSKPNFPWQNHTFEELTEKVAVGHRASIIATMFLAGASYPEMTNDPQIALSEAALFSAKTSARRLEAIAKISTESAMLAAMHPNGGDLTPPTKESSKLVATFRSKFTPQPLAGKQTIELPTDKEGIVI